MIAATTGQRIAAYRRLEINGKLYVALAGVKPGPIELTLQREQYYLAASASDDIKG